jgi:phosphoglucosamine mutase
MSKLFGTDGIRGRAGEYPLDEATVAAIGNSLAMQLYARLGRSARIISGRDTRESGPWIERAFHRGAIAAGAECVSAGVITTPGVALLTRLQSMDSGVVISASHNPFEDNGIKVFLPTGRKLDEVTERAIETEVAAEADIEMPPAEIAMDEERSYRDYLGALAEEALGLNLNGVKIAMDCANGAAYRLAPELLRSLGAEVEVINDDPDGRNINEGCGSLHLNDLQSLVRNSGADLGVAFDGDADRALFVDENGAIVDGDATLWIMACYMQRHGLLKNFTVVATVMSNIGLEIALAGKGLNLLRAAVGDRYVLEELLATGSELGGEQSGHIIFPSASLVGDGLRTTLNLLRAWKEAGQPLSSLCEGFTRYPQVLVNVKVKTKQPFESVNEIAAASRQIENELNGTGRLLLRYSGTENLARVMIEGRDQASIESQARRLADVIARSLG